jgi:hypothetical protein
MIEKSENITNLASALLKAQIEIGVALKNEKNPYFKSAYADLKSVIDSVKEPLNKNGLAFLQAVDSLDGNPVIDTILLHESGQYLSTRTPVFCAKPNDPQAFGSGVTYSKRYALQALLGLPTADDDAEAAMARNGKPEVQPKIKSKDLIEEAFMAYQEAHISDLQEGHIFDMGKFKTQIIAVFKRLPTRKDSIPKIIEKIKPEDVSTEMKNGSPG